MQKQTFKDSTIVKLKKNLQVVRVDTLDSLQNWLASNYQLSPLEQTIIETYQANLMENVDAWNEQELALNFIGPIIALAGFGREKNFNAFSERYLTACFDEIELSGKVDGMIAAGKEEPEVPYFCLQEYKRDTDPDGDPKAQVLAAMLVAQKLNDNAEPIFGAYVKGRNWFFMTLEEKKYAISPQFDATQADVFDIFRLLMGLKSMIEEKLN
jgi:hypothetical protein